MEVKKSETGSKKAVGRTEGKRGNYNGKTKRGREGRGGRARRSEYRKRTGRE